MKLSEWPKPGDYAVLKVKRVMPYGAIADLEEYGEKDCFIHISNVANARIKNIRSYISEGNVRVGVIINVDTSKKSIEASLRRVTEQEEKRKLEDWKREKRADKLFERLCKSLKEDYIKTYETIVPKLSDNFGDLLSAFENASLYGEEAFAGMGLPEKFVAAFVSHAKENIVPAEVVVKGNLTLKSRKGDGILAIKEVLKKMNQPSVRLEYISAPKYRVIVTGQEYSDAEKLLNSVVQNAIETIEKLGGEGSFERIKG
jgi:translation initiation factor 2 subunit 1